MTNNKVRIGKRIIGDNEPVMIVLEAGATHTGIESALKLVDAAAASGADAIKFQVVDVERLMSDMDVPFAYKILIDKASGETKEITEPLKDILTRREMPLDDWKKVKQHCDQVGLEMFCTALFEETALALIEMGVPSIKIASGDINHHYLIRKVAKTGTCIQLDTGAATIGEIEKAVDICLSEGNDQIIIHHCPSGYPARLEGINLKIIKTLKHMFEFPIAFSDHTPGWDMDIAAVALGANLIEKTITLDRTARSCEHMFSLEPNEIGQFVETIRDIETAFGHARRLLTQEERNKNMASRRSIVAKNDLKEGHTLTHDCIDFKRPGGGIPPDAIDWVIGKRLIKDLVSGHILKWEDIRI